MKTIMLILISALLWTAAGAQQDSTSKKKLIVPADHYCVVLKEKKPEVSHNGKVIKQDTHLLNGNKITPSGTVVHADGTVQVIKPGSCVNSEGREVEHATGTH